MIKKSAVLRSLFLLGIFIVIAQTIAFAEEKTALQYFGVGADVEAAGAGEYIVKTKGEKAEEGFVYTPKEEFTNENISYQIDLKGNGTILLKISETDARGRFIKEETKEIKISDQWSTYSMPYTLESKSSQIDVFVVTKEPLKTEFFFKNLQVK